MRLLCDPLGDAGSPNVDFVGCKVTNTATTITIAVRVAGTITDDSQYRLNLKTTSFNGQLKYNAGKVTSPLHSLVVTRPDASELDFTFNRSEVGLSGSGALQWSAEAQQGIPGQPSVGFPDDMPNSGYFLYVVR